MNNDFSAHPSISKPGAVENAQLSATAVYRQAAQQNHIRHFFDEVFVHAKEETARVRVTPNQHGGFDPDEMERANGIKLRLATDVAEIFSALLTVSPERRHELAMSVQGPDRQALVERVLMDIPAGARWLEAKATRDAATEGLARLHAEQRGAAWAAGAPARLIEAIEAGGTVLSVGRPKGIAAGGAEIDPALLDELTVHRDAVVELLEARAAASKPRLVVA